MLARSEVTILAQRRINIDEEGGGFEKRRLLELWCKVHQIYAESAPTILRLLVVTLVTQNSGWWSSAMGLVLAVIGGNSRRRGETY